MSELLNKNDKDYVSQRSQLTFRECPNSRRQKKSLSIQIEKRGKEKKESFLTHLLDDYLHTRKNDTSDNTNILNKKKSAEHLSIISPKDEEFGNFDYLMGADIDFNNPEVIELMNKVKHITDEAERQRR